MKVLIKNRLLSGYFILTVLLMLFISLNIIIAQKWNFKNPESTNHHYNPGDSTYLSKLADEIIIFRDSFEVLNKKEKVLEKQLGDMGKIIEELDKDILKLEDQLENIKLLNLYKSQ